VRRLDRPKRPRPPIPAAEIDAIGAGRKHDSIVGLARRTPVELGIAVGGGYRLTQTARAVVRGIVLERS
jgi:hypothetical protein